MFIFDLGDGSGGGSSEKKKFGASISTLIGNVTSDGSLVIPNEHADLVFEGVKSIASQALMWKFKDTAVQSVSFPDLEKVHTPSAMEGTFFTASVSSVSFPKLEEISGASCMSKCFQYTSLESVEFPVLETLSARFGLELAFANCRNIKSISFPALTNNFGLYTNQFNLMLSGVSGCTVHFPALLQSVLSEWEDVQNGFGGTNTVVVFDL